jgi:hypothetical protein
MEKKQPAMSLSAKDEALTQAIGEILVQEIERACKPLRERIEALERRGYKGGYQRAATYSRGDQVSADGSLFVAIMDVPPGARPGQSDHWQLQVKRGNGA